MTSRVEGGRQASGRRRKAGEGGGDRGGADRDEAVRSRNNDGIPWNAVATRAVANGTKCCAKRREHRRRHTQGRGTQGIHTNQPARRHTHEGTTKQRRKNTNENTGTNQPNGPMIPRRGSNRLHARESRWMDERRNTLWASARTAARVVLGCGSPRAQSSGHGEGTPLLRRATWTDDTAVE